ncbi:MAG: cache domain-containing protein, partial [Magnetococcales bacterium]|nr:cache domain-containing protein [Magnetococcales bacterium]
EASFRLKAGEIFTSAPYMSPDSEFWVIAYTSPVVMPNGEIPAFFHFEVPLDVYGKLISSKDYSYATALQQHQPDKEEEGRFFLVDKEGLLLADSRQALQFGLRAQKNPNKNHDAADFMLHEKLADYVPKATSISDDPVFVQTIGKMRQGESGEAHLLLQNRAYLLLYRPVPGRSWSLGHLDPVGGAGFWEQGK